MVAQPAGKIFLFIFIIIGLPNLTGCDCGGTEVPQSYTYQLQLFDPSNKFIRITYSTNLITDTPNSNVTAWKLSISRPVTTMYFKTLTGLDTLTYAIHRKMIYYNDRTCGENIDMYIDGPEIIQHSFNTVYFDTAASNGYSHSSITLILK